MTELEKYIRENIGSFDSEPVPAGSKERFLHAAASERRKKAVRIISLVFSGLVAACAAVLISVVEPDLSKELARHHTRLADAENEIIMTAEKNCPHEMEMIISSIRSITAEAIPLEDQLPEEMSKKEKRRILDKYYKQKQKALKSLLAEL